MGSVPHFPHEQIQGMTPAEEIAWFRQKVENGPYADLWRRVAARNEKSEAPGCAEEEGKYGDKLVSLRD